MSGRELDGLLDAEVALAIDDPSAPAGLTWGESAGIALRVQAGLLRELVAAIEGRPGITVEQIVAMCQSSATALAEAADRVDPEGSS